MSGVGPLLPARIPTLTEVVDWPPSAAAAGVTSAAVAQAQPVEAELTDARPLPTLRLPEDQMIQRVLAELQRQVDLMLEYRLRETLTPMLTRATDSLIRDARSELASTLREVVARAVAQELSRHRTR